MTEKIIVYRSRSEKLLDEVFWDYGGVWVLAGVLILYIFLRVVGGK